jgi:hypothetical protein
VTKHTASSAPGSPKRAVATQDGDASATSTAPGQPGPWDAPWHRKEDATGWETVYRGTGQRREVTNRVVLDLTPEQWSWVGRRARSARATPHAVIRQLIDAARAVDDSVEPTTASAEPSLRRR